MQQTLCRSRQAMAAVNIAADEQGQVSSPLSSASSVHAGLVGSLPPTEESAIQRCMLRSQGSQVKGHGSRGQRSSMIRLCSSQLLWMLPQMSMALCEHSRL